MRCALAPLPLQVVQQRVNLARLVLIGCVSPKNCFIGAGDMPTPAKPCVGAFNEEIIASLQKNVGHAQWLAHPCAVCGQQVGAKIALGKWTPEPHWPSVRYVSRAKRSPKTTSLVSKTL